MARFEHCKPACSSEPDTLDHKKQAAFDENSKKAAIESLLREEQEKKATRKQLTETQKAMSADYDKRLNHDRNVRELAALEQKIEVRWEREKRVEILWLGWRCRMLVIFCCDSFMLIWHVEGTKKDRSYSWLRCMNAGLFFDEGGGSQGRPGKDSCSRRD